jgi:sialate O-acetylesterase
VQESVRVPVGLIQEAVGGVPAETFISGEGLQAIKDFDRGVAEVERLRKKGGRQYGNYIMHWYDKYDIGSKSGSWADPACRRISAVLPQFH